ncbi:MAG TPA: hypothetical protein VH092_19035 [Urbifossiella sp.]|jgi:hypothetical protein|nr:hypothetical protein [Urbifossiella sp.]
MKGFQELDRVLRGEAARAGQPGPAVSFLPLLTANVLLAAFYGVCMGVYGVSGRDEPEFRQMLADAVKVPLLFLLTLFVTFPSLYVFSALVGSRLGAADLARLLTAALGVLLAVLAAFGPIVGFFSVTTTSYPFVVLMNVAVFTLAAVFGLSYLTRTLDHMLPRPVARPVRPPARADEHILVAEVEGEPAPPPPPVVPAVTLPSPAAVRTVVRVWLVAFALVGAQMSWVLRPFIGSPRAEFTWLRPRQSSFFEGVAKSVRQLLTP